MATSITELYNLALDTIGARNRVASPLEDSKEAEACNLWFPNIRDQVLASASWPEATKMERLALLSAQDGDTWVQGEARPDFSNAYALPSDYIWPQYIYGFEKFVVQSYGAENRALMTNQTSPVLVYTFRQQQLGMWSPQLQMAIMSGLAASICTSLTGKTSRAKLLIEQANSIIISARETAANTNSEPVLESIPDWIAARGFSDGGTQNRFFYPYGATLTLGNVN